MRSHTYHTYALLMHMRLRATTQVGSLHPSGGYVEQPQPPAPPNHSHTCVCLCMRTSVCHYYSRAQVGSLHPSGDALMQAVTGSPLDPTIFLAYLTAKYTTLYKL